MLLGNIREVDFVDILHSLRRWLDRLGSKEALLCQVFTASLKRHFNNLWLLNLGYTLIAVIVAIDCLHDPLVLWHLLLAQAEFAWQTNILHRD